MNDMQLSRRNGVRGKVRALLMTGMAVTALGTGARSMADAPHAADMADTVLYNGDVHWDGPEASALAITDGIIVAVGSLADMEGRIGPDTARIDLDLATVLPGLIDMHAHPLYAGRDQSLCQVSMTHTLPQVEAAIAACAATAAPGEWIVARAYEPSSLKGMPHRSLLDRAAPNNPVVISEGSHHAAWANSRALELANITDDTPDPAGGIIQRDDAGHATGVLLETADQLVLSLPPSPTRSETRDHAAWALKTMASYGIVAVQDALVKPDVAQAYLDLAEMGELPIHVSGCISGDERELIASRAFYSRPGLEFGCVKLFLDGVPNKSKTGAMNEPYLQSDHDHGNQTGLLMIPPVELNEMVTEFDASGLVVKMHATGDRAVEVAIDAIAAARAANGPTGIQHQVAHVNFATPESLEEAAELGAVLEFSPYLWDFNPLVMGVVAAVGEDRMDRWSPIREAIDDGALVLAGSDWDVVPSVDPWRAMQTLAGRGMAGDLRGPGPKEAISFAEAFDMFTINAARALGQSDETGSIAIGKSADIIVVDRDPFDLPVEAVDQTRVLRTMVDGKTVYEVSDARSSE